MYHLSMLEEYYRKFMSDLPRWAPEGVVTVDLSLLQDLNLLSDVGENKVEPPLTQYFHAIESIDKLTLVNDQFVIWITPEKTDDDEIVTLTLIALNRPNGPELEVVFAAGGAYNSSRLILRVLERMLAEIQENEDVLENMDKE